MSAETLAIGINAIARVNAAVTDVLRWTAGVLLAVMLAIVILQVVFRYGLNNSLSWSEELSKSLMVASAFFIAPWAYRHSANVELDTLVSEISPALRTASYFVIHALVLWVAVLFLGQGLNLVARSGATPMATIPIPAAVFYATTPLAFAGLIVVGIELIARRVLQITAPRAAEGLSPIADRGLQT